MLPACLQCLGQMGVFVDRYSSSTQPLSIGYSAELTRARIGRRRDEVQSLIDASNAHIYAGVCECVCGCVSGSLVHSKRFRYHDV